MSIGSTRLQPLSISVLIPTHGRPTLLGRTLASLAACDIPDEYVETVIIENGPKSGAEAVVGDAAVDYPHLNLRYMHVERANKSHALNMALETVADGLVVYFDDDVVVKAMTLLSYARASAFGSGRFFGGAFSVRYEDQPPEWVRTALPQSALGCSETDLESMGYAFGFNWAAFVDDVRTAGGFDVAFGPGSPSGATGQETELQTRMKKKGMVFEVVPNAMVEHYVPRVRSSSDWVVGRRYRLGVSSGQQIARGDKRNVIPRDCLWALRSLCLLPPFWLLRNRKKVFGHKLNIARAAGLIYGFLWMKRYGNGSPEL